MRTHDLKCKTEYFQKVKAGVKKFEIRRNDRDFQVGDRIYLYEFDGKQQTSERIGPLKIKYIFQGKGYGLENGFCIINW